MWEKEFEAFPGATVLRDLLGARGDAATIRRVLARYLALRYLQQAVTGTCLELLQVERSAAKEHLHRGWPTGHAARGALELAIVRVWDAGSLCEWLCIAAEDAELEGHGAGARALYYAGYEFALGDGYLDAAARAAASMALLAASGGGERSSRLWQRRAKVIARAAARGRSG